jgi:tocopherol O-methyltransferase
MACRLAHRCRFHPAIAAGDEVSDKRCGRSRVIWPNVPQPTAAVAAHYDQLDRYYREIWGDHVHHGYWATGSHSVEEAVEALINLLADRLDLRPGQQLCDIGCGYGATAHYLAGRHNLRVIGLTISGAQAEQSRARVATAGEVSILQMDWLANGLASNAFDHSYAIESTEHMPDKQRFFDEAFRTLKPGGLFAVCAWLACDNPRPWQVRHLLEPICREGRLTSMGDEAHYLSLAKKIAGFGLISIEDLSDRVSRTWWICAKRLMTRLFTRPRHMKFLLDSAEPNRIFAVTLFRLLIAYRTRSMRYGLFVFRKPQDVHGGGTDQ